MKYVFFDIECANYIDDVFTICTFGYTITDSEFNIIKQEDILINPCSPFNKIVLRKIIHYQEEDFLDKKLYDVGIPLYHIIAVRKGMKYVYYELSKDKNEVLGGLFE